jgi:signal transduction histidine kinase
MNGPMAASSAAPRTRTAHDAASRRAPAAAAIASRPRLVLGVVVVVGTMLLQVATDVVAGRQSARILARLAFMLAELPLLMPALSAAFAWSIRRRMSAGQGLLTGVGIATAFGCVFGLLYGVVAQRVPELRLHFPNGLSFSRTTLFGILNAQLYFGLWALAFVYPLAVESARVRALEAQQLRSDAELARLRAHLEPHFLLNTLNAIAGLVTEDPREARRLLVCLGDLLRDAVQDRSERQRLGEQIAWLRRYAQILEARHRGALRFRWDIAPACERLLLPRLLLQPLVENAVKHGALRRRDGAGEVVIHASMADGGTLVCVVADNGPGMPDSDVRAGAFGLQSVRRRLELEARDASLRFESSSEGTRSIVEIAGVREA